MGRMYLAVLFTCLLLLTGITQGNKINKAKSDESGSEGGGEGRREGGGEGRNGGIVVIEVDGGVVVVENGTLSAVLDCPFKMPEEDLIGLSIRWYHDSLESPVYQWIPDSNPVAMWILRDRVDLSYEASQDAPHRHRALRILEPTTDLAGYYECRALTFTKEYIYRQKFLVFRQPSDVELLIEEKDEGEVAISCEVGDAFPQPKLQLYLKASTGDKEEVRGFNSSIHFEGKTYSARLKGVIKESELEGPTEFECLASIPETEVGLSASTKYQPRVTITTDPVISGGNSNSRQQHYSTAFLTLLMLLMFLMP